MKPDLRLVLLLAFALAAGGCAGVSLNQNFSPVAAAVPAAGESWSYRVVNGYNKLEVGRTRMQVTAAGADRFEVLVTADGAPAGTPVGFTRDWNPDSGVYPVGLAMAGFWKGIPPGAPVRYAPALPAFRFPLVPGKSWSETVAVSDPATGMRVPVLVHARVEGMETMTVPAGQFDAIKVSRSLYYQDAEWWRGPVFQQVTDWFAPSLNRVVLRRERSEYYDHARRGHNDGPLLIYGDYLFHELVELAPARR